jgi:hypothetical protein
MGGKRGTMTRDEARARFREILEPIRILAEMEYAVPDVQDTIQLLLVHEQDEEVHEARYRELMALASEAGFSWLTRLTEVFEEDPA